MPALVHPRERETLCLMAHGQSNAAVAALLVAIEANVAKRFCARVGVVLESRRQVLWALGFAGLGILCAWDR
jgi:hypothetical protein